MSQPTPAPDSTQELVSLVRLVTESLTQMASRVHRAAQAVDSMTRRIETESRETQGRLDGLAVNVTELQRVQATCSAELARHDKRLDRLIKMRQRQANRIWSLLREPLAHALALAVGAFGAWLAMHGLGGQ